jgi:hypothetical protein
MDHRNDFPVVYCTPDKMRRGDTRAPTVSYLCSCGQRHEHGNPARYDKPGQEIGTFGSHCDSGGDIRLVIGPDPKSPGTHVAVSVELAAIFA